MSQDTGTAQLYKMSDKKVTKNIPDPRIEGNLALEPKKQKKVPVKSKKNAVVPQFIPTKEGLQAAVQYYSAANGGESGSVAYLVDLINTQSLTNEANRIRGALGPSNVSDSKLEELASKRIYSTPELMQKIMSMAGDANRIQTEVIDPLKAQIRLEQTSGNSDDYEFIEGGDDTEENNA